MKSRWIASEVEAIAKVRKALKNEFENRPQFPEVVGDRRILRFLRGKQHNLDETIKMIRDFLQWRIDNNVDSVRQDILYGGKESPYNFPKGKMIIDLAPQIVLSVNALDRCGQPLSLEQFNFSPKEVFKAVTLNEYLLFLTYCLEYRALVLEQVSHEREIAYLKSHPEEERLDGYGVIVMDFTIRDLKGVGLAHLGSEGRSLVQAALKLGLPNYPEYMGKSHMVNVPWVFSSMWYFVKGLLDEFTLAKLTLSGSDYMSTLLKDVPFESIPRCLGGGFDLYNEPYHFDLSPEGSLYYPGAPNVASQQGAGVAVASQPVVANDEVTVTVAGETKGTGDAESGSCDKPVELLSIPPEAKPEAICLSAQSLNDRLRCSGIAVVRELQGAIAASPLLSLLMLSLVCAFCAAHPQHVLHAVLPSAAICAVLTCILNAII